MTWKLARVGVLGVWVMVGCGTDPPVAPPRPGVERGAADAIAVVALDEVTRAPLASTQVTLFGPDGVLGTLTTDIDGRAQLATDAALVAVELAEPGHVTERWMVGGRRVVVPLQARTTSGTLERTLTGVGEGELWTVIATSPARVLHANPLGVSAHASCEPTGDGRCTARLDGVAVDDTTSLFAFRMGASGPEELRILGTLDEDLLAADRFAVTRLDVSIPDPGEGSTAVVGVPGLGVSGRVAVLPWPISEGSLFVPDTDSTLGSAWVVFSSAHEDGSTSVLLQRGAPAAASWTDWIAPGDLAGLTLARSPETDLVAVAWYGDDLIRHDLYVRGAVSIVLDPPGGARRAIVRGIDTRAIDVDLDLDAAERETVRFADRPLSL